MIKHYFFFLLLLSSTTFSQNINQIINSSEVEKIERILSDDNMQGRAVNTPGIDKAADFIADEFGKAGLQPVKDDSFFQQFKMVSARFIEASGTVNGEQIPGEKIVALSSATDLSINQASGYEKLRISDRTVFLSTIKKLKNERKNYLVLVDPSLEKMAQSLKRSLMRGFFPSEYSNTAFPADYNNNVVVVITKADPVTYSIEYKQEVKEQFLKNVVGVLPGKTKANEYVIFSGHYDHLGIGKVNEAGDSIYNGANDDAAGITAVIMLARYFAQQKDNECTLVFAAFTAEESGGFGSRYFSEQYDPNKVVAMFNIEMIGTESKWGTNSAYITGYEKTDMGKILQKNLAGSGFTFYPDPYPSQQLFYRSDNATLAMLGVPAHTISTSKMDSEKFYHTQEDELETLDMQNMTEIIKAIAISLKSIIMGKDVPTRVDTQQLR